jgi:hypothetical protein
MLQRRLRAKDSQFSGLSKEEDANSTIADDFVACLALDISARLMSI